MTTSTLVEIEDGPVLKIYVQLAFRQNYTTLVAIANTAATRVMGIDVRRVAFRFISVRRQLISGDALELEVLTESEEDAMRLRSSADNMLAGALYESGILTTQIRTVIVLPNPSVPIVGRFVEPVGWMSSEAIIGVAVGLGVGIPILLVCITLYFYWQYRRRFDAQSKLDTDEVYSAEQIVGEVCYPREGKLVPIKPQIHHLHKTNVSTNSSHNLSRQVSPKSPPPAPLLKTPPTPRMYQIGVTGEPSAMFARSRLSSLSAKSALWNSGQFDDASPQLSNRSFVQGSLTLALPASPSQKPKGRTFEYEDHVYGPALSGARLSGSSTPEPLSTRGYTAFETSPGRAQRLANSRYPKYFEPTPEPTTQSLPRRTLPLLIGRQRQNKMETVDLSRDVHLMATPNLRIQQAQMASGRRMLPVPLVAIGTNSPVSPASYTLQPTYYFPEHDV
jgi:hypothetical protein